MGSRSLDDLLVQVRVKVLSMLAFAEALGVPLIVTSTYRSWKEQNDLYSHGRGHDARPRVTNARGGHSWHNFRRACDVWPKGQLDPSDETWAIVGHAARKAGLEWGGDWVSFVDSCHVQLTEGLSLADERRLWKRERHLLIPR